MPEISRPAMLPAPQNSRVPASASSAAIATAAPRVLRSASWARVSSWAGGHAGRAAKTASAASAASAATGPWPSPSATISEALAPSARNDQASPHTVSPGAARQTAPAMKRFAAAGTADRAFASSTRPKMTVPLPSTENIENSSHRRCTAPRPVPAVPPVE